jgi:hypothetical protein
MDGWMMCACMHAHEEKTMWVSKYVNNKSVLYFFNELVNILLNITIPWWLQHKLYYFLEMLKFSKINKLRE